MAVISDVKCARCDRRYSGFRSRCPYCGARRSKRGKHAEESDNSKAKLMVGVLLLLVLIVATMVLLFTNKVSTSSGSDGMTNAVTPSFSNDEDIITVTGSPDANASNDANASDNANTSDDANASDNANASDDANASDNANASDDANATSSPSPTDTSGLEIESVTITSRGDAVTDITLAKIGDTEKLSFSTTPKTSGKVAKWESSDNTIFTVIDGKVTAMGRGSATLKVTVDGKTAKCIIRVRGTA